MSAALDPTSIRLIDFGRAICWSQELEWVEGWETLCKRELGIVLDMLNRVD